METLKINKFSKENVWDYENGFYLFSSPVRIAKICAQWEVFKLISNLPGDIVEFGVYKGASLFRLATFRDMQGFALAKKIYAFDTFGEFPTENISNSHDKSFIHAFSTEGGNSFSIEDITEALKLKEHQNIILIKGLVENTLPKFLDENSATRFSLVHLDLDVLEPTHYVLENIFDRIVRGGILMIDDYNYVYGATKAIDNFLVKNPTLKLKKFDFAHSPTYLIKN